MEKGVERVNIEVEEIEVVLENEKNFQTNVKNHKETKINVKKNVEDQVRDINFTAV